MKRLAVAAVLAVGVHVAVLRIDVPWTWPVIATPRSRAVDISLVTLPKPAEVKEKSAPHPQLVPLTAPVAQPKPRPKPVRLVKPAAKPVKPPKPRRRAVRPEPVAAPKPAGAEPMIGPAPDPDPAVAAESSSAVNHQPPSDEEHAAIQASVPLYDLNPPPVYPRVARRRNYEGTVLLEVRVTAEGQVADVRLAHSSGYAVLDRSAIEAVGGWRFEPARRAGRPIETWVQVPVRFRLR